MTAVSKEPFFQTRRIGDAEVTVVSEGVLRWAPRLQAPEAQWRREIPEADEQGVVPFGMQVALVRVGDSTVLIDPGFGDPGSKGDTSSQNIVRSPGLQAALDALGVAPAAITHVLITHTHGDHFEGVTTERGGRRVPRYPQARVSVGRADWEQSPQRVKTDSPLVTHLGLLERLGLLDLVDEERDIVRGVSMMPCPGESPGHCVVRVRTAGRTFFYLGDLVHHACEIAHLDWMPAGRSAEALLESRGRILREAAESEATVVYSHEPFPPWGTVVRAGAGYRWRRG